MGSSSLFTKRLMAGVLFVLAFSSVLPAASSTPNIVYIISDVQAWTDYGFMGHPQIETPNLDRLAARPPADPHENRNLARDNPELVAKLAARLDQWWLPSERKMLRRWTD